jgi:hypothetical protein
VKAVQKKRGRRQAPELGKTNNTEIHTTLLTPPTQNDCTCNSATSAVNDRSTSEIRKQTKSSLHKHLSFVATMMEFRTTGYNGYAVKYSPFVNDRVAVATAANFGLVGNGRLYILGLTANGILLQRQ